MENDINNKIIEDVLASFRMDFMDVPYDVINKAKESLEINKKKKLILIKKEKKDGFR